MNTNKLMSQGVVTRFAPSPTGFLHIGSARTALFNELFARKQSGTFIVRIEDTDRARSTKEFEQDILEGLAWLSIVPDEIYRQSERGDVYERYIRKLVDNDAAYVSKEAEGERREVIRFRNPNIDITFSDRVRGNITFNTADLGDFVIARSMSDPLYHLAVVVDDFEMGVTHVIRGEDGISNTPRQILLQRALDMPEPVYAHLPLILAPDKSKLSKRHGAVSVTEYKERGYLPEAVVNFLALLGWNPGTDQEVFDREGLVSAFSIEHIQKGGAVFNEEKLAWMNREYIKHMPLEKKREKVRMRLAAHVETLPDELLDRLLPVLLERVSVWGDIDELARTGEIGYFFERPDPDPAQLPWKDSTPTEAKDCLREVYERLGRADQIRNPEEAKELMWSLAEEKGRGAVLWPVRYALSGREKSPDPFTLCYILGIEEARARIARAIELL